MDGYIDLKKSNNKWWFRQKKLFLSIGINHIDPYFLLASYNKSLTLKRYGNDFIHNKVQDSFNSEGNAAKIWYEEIKNDLYNWGFNTLGLHTEIPLNFFKGNFYYIIPINPAPIEQYTDFANETTWIDIFSSEYKKELEIKVKSICENHKHSKNMIGYAFSDIPRWPTNLNYKVKSRFSKLIQKDNEQNEIFHPWVKRLLSLKDSDKGKKVCINILKDNYSNFEDLRIQYRLEEKSWGEIQYSKKWESPVNYDKAKKDNWLIMERIALEYYRTTYNLIKKYDPYHLILGDKLDGNKEIPSYLYTALQNYTDIIYIQYFGLFRDQKKILIELNERLNKPILIGDFAFSTIKQYQKYSKGFILSSSREVGQHTFKYLKDLFTLPFIVGWHHCGYLEGMKGVECFNDPFADIQCGLKDPYGTPNKILINYISAANRLVYSWHQKK